MKKLVLLSVLLLCSIVLMAQQTLAVTVSLAPSAPTIGLSDPVSVEVTIADLRDFAPPSLGAFLVEVTFDDSILSFDSVAFGSLLGDPLDPLETDIVVDTSTPGVVSLDEFSFLFDFELDTLQPASFTLATLSFTGSGVGTSALGFGTVDLSDAGFPANTLTVAALVGTSISIESGPSTVIPEPSTWLLMGTGLLGLAGYRWRRQSYSA